MKAENLPDLIKYLTVIYFSLFSVFYAILMMPGLQNFASTQYRAIRMASSIIIFIRRHCLQCLILSAAESNNVEAYISFLRQEIPLSGFESHDRNCPQSLLPAGK